MAEIGAIILAAGMSSRMGSAKQFLPLGEKPLFRHAVDRAVASGLAPILVVGGEHHEKLREQTSDLPQVEVFHNPHYATGMASSLACGIRAMTGKADAVLVFLADQPYVPGQVIQALVDTYRQQRDAGVRIVRPLYAGEAGHPVLFDAALFAELAQVTGDQGGKEVVSQYKQHLRTIPFERAEWGLDVDTPDDYRRIQKAPGCDRED
ncbi:nucleotidyltransferase family protein [Brevibacillus sp. TJ4]|uniref:nucleotidyltransferase family protein n=1 Tax=Brevibacillus sp. TJ4 TaxID=3234853 RepID=UPI0037D00F7B